MTPSTRPSTDWQAAAHPGPAALQGNLDAALQQASGAAGPGGAWRRGWALVALGRFGEAWTSLAQCGAPDTPYGAAGAVTRASLLRQIGLHDRAEAEDTAAAHQAPAGSEIAAAAAIGLVADAVGNAAGAEALEQRLVAAGAAVAVTGSPRQRVRMAWVAGEVAMVTGEAGLAEGRFTAAAEAAKAMRAHRHHAKSLVFVAAAQAAISQRADAVRTAHAAMRQALELRAVPLQWAAHLVLADLEEDEGHRRDAAMLLAGALEGLPPEIRGLAARRPPAQGLLDA